MMSDFTQDKKLYIVDIKVFKKTKCFSLSIRTSKICICFHLKVFLPCSNNKTNFKFFQNYYYLHGKFFSYIVLLK